MKRFLVLIIILFAGISLYSQNIFKYPVHANGGIRVGGNTKVRVDSLSSDGTDIKFYNTNDTLTPYIPYADRLAAQDVVFMMADSNSYGGAITRSYFETYGGGGGGGSAIEMLRLPFIIGTTSGAPSAGDSVVTHASFAGKNIDIYRDGAKQYQYLTATDDFEHFRFNSTTGAVTVHPAFIEGEQIIVEAFEPITWTTLALSGEESSLLTGLIAGWQFDEVSGTRAFEVQDNIGLDGVLSGGVLVNQTGKFGKAYDFDGSNDGVSMGTDAYLRPTGSFSISVWVKTTYADYGAIVANYRYTGGSIYGYGLVLFPDGTVEWGVRYAGSNNIIQSTSTVNDGNWHNIIATFNGTNTNIYIDGGSSEATNATAGTIVYNASNEFEVGIRDLAGDIPFDGTIDDVYIWSKILSAGERTTLQTYSYPFN